MINKFTEYPSQEELLAESLGFLQMVSGQNIAQILDNTLSLPVQTVENIPNSLSSLLNQKAAQA